MSPSGHRIELYVSGNSAEARDVRTRIESLCRRHLESFELEQIDILAEPGRAEAAGVLATPTLIRVSPPPEIRVSGDLGDERGLLAALALPSSAR